MTNDNLYLDSDCGRCVPGSHCHKCLSLDPFDREVLMPPLESRWLSCYFIPDSKYVDDLLFQVKNMLRTDGKLTSSVERGLPHILANLCSSKIVKHKRRDFQLDHDGAKVSRDSLNNAVDALGEIGLLTRSQGRKAVSVGTFSGTPAFYRLAARYKPIWKWVPPAIELRSAEKKAQPIPKLSRNMKRLAQHLSQINDFNSSYPLLLMKSPKSRVIIRPLLRMVFNKSLMFGGRVYDCGDHYQNLPRLDRKRLWLHGERVAEPDFSAHHIRLAYALEEISYSESYSNKDPYHLVMNSKVIDRTICKVLVLVSINTNSKSEALSAYRSKPNDEAPYHAQLGNIYDAFFEKHTPIAHWFGSGKSNGSKLHKIEGEIMVRAMHTLMNYGVPSYPVHDSLIVPKSKADIATDTMRKAYHQTLRARGKRNYDEPVVVYKKVFDNLSENSQKHDHFPLIFGNETVVNKGVFGGVANQSTRILNHV